MSLNSKPTCNVLVQPHLEQYNGLVMCQIHWLQLHMFVRHGAVRKPLQSPYDGPYPVLERTEKFFTLNINGRKDTVSVDWLKPAHLNTTDTNHPPSQSQPAPTTRVTRSGRHVHWSPNIATCLKTLGGEWCCGLWTLNSVMLMTSSLLDIHFCSTCSGTF